MTDEKINIAIAEACGWTCCGKVEGCKPHGYPPDIRKPTTRELLDGTGPLPWDIPNYCDDLNSMHEAEKILNEEQKEKYFFNLMCVFGNWPKAIQATAKQRAEAFLRTLGKWKEAAK